MTLIAELVCALLLGIRPVLTLSLIPQCPPGEEFQSSCSACPDTCVNRRFLQPRPCVKGRPPCGGGCFCKPGFVRDDGGACVQPSQCGVSNPFRPVRPVTTVAVPMGAGRNCPVNEAYSTCGHCQLTCANRNSILSCHANCRPGCYCIGGLVRNNAGVCVLPRDCPSNYATTNPVPPTYPVSPIVSPVKPVNPIVQPAPTVCPDGEVFERCRSSCREDTCANEGQQRVCTRNCISKCFCNRGLVRNSQGKCVHPSQCPIRPANPFNPVNPSEPIVAPVGPRACPANETYFACQPCQLTCASRNAMIACSAVCRSGCACAGGRMRNSSGICVLPGDCPPMQGGIIQPGIIGGPVRPVNPVVRPVNPLKPVNPLGPNGPNGSCPANATYQYSCSQCPRSCGSPEGFICTQSCYSSCQCNGGFVRNANGDCVLMSDCPPGTKGFEQSKLPKQPVIYTMPLVGPDGRPVPVVRPSNPIRTVNVNPNNPIGPKYPTGYGIPITGPVDVQF